MALGGNTNTTTLGNQHLFGTPAIHLTPDVVDMVMYMEYDDNKGVLSIKPYIQTMARCQASPAYRQSLIQWLQVIDLWSPDLTLHDGQLSVKNAAHLTALPTTDLCFWHFEYQVSTVLWLLNYWYHNISLQKAAHTQKGLVRKSYHQAWVAIPDLKYQEIQQLEIPDNPRLERPGNTVTPLQRSWRNRLPTASGKQRSALLISRCLYIKIPRVFTMFSPLHWDVIGPSAHNCSWNTPLGNDRVLKSPTRSFGLFQKDVFFGQQNAIKAVPSY